MAAAGGGGIESGMKIGQIIRGMRKLHGMTLRDVSRGSGLSIALLSHLETGVQTNPTLDTLRKLAKCWNLTVVDLLNSLE